MTCHDVSSGHVMTCRHMTWRYVTSGDVSFHLYPEIKKKFWWRHDVTSWRVVPWRHDVSSYELTLCDVLWRFVSPGPRSWKKFWGPEVGCISTFRELEKLCGTEKVLVPQVGSTNTSRELEKVCGTEKVLVPQVGSTNFSFVARTWKSCVSLLGHVFTWRYDVTSVYVIMCRHVASWRDVMWRHDVSSRDIMTCRHMYFLWIGKSLWDRKSFGTTSWVHKLFLCSENLKRVWRVVPWRHDVSSYDVTLRDVLWPFFSPVPRSWKKFWGPEVGCTSTFRELEKVCGTEKVLVPQVGSTNTSFVART